MLNSPCSWDAILTQHRTAALRYRRDDHVDRHELVQPVSEAHRGRIRLVAHDGYRALHVWHARLGRGRGAVRQARRRPRRAPGHSRRNSPHGGRFLRHEPFAKFVATVPLVRDYDRDGDGSLWTGYHFAPRLEALRRKETGARR